MENENTHSIAEAVDFHQGLQESWIPEILSKAGLKPVKGMVVALSFPTSGGEAVVPPTDKDGRPNPTAGEAKRRFQFIPRVATTDGRISKDIKKEAVLNLLTRGAKVGADAPVLCLTPAKHNPTAGSTFGMGDDPTAEVAKRIETQLHANIFASIMTFPPDGITLTKGDKVKVYGGHFERYASKLGLLGKGWTCSKELRAELLDLAKTAPTGASITLDVPEKSEEKSTTSVTLQAADGTRFAISAKVKAGKKDAGKRSVLELLRTAGPFIYVEDAEGKKKQEKASEAAQAS